MLLRIYKVSSRLAKWKTVYGIFGMMGQYVLSGQSRIPLLDSVNMFIRRLHTKEYILTSQSCISLLDILTHHTGNSVNDLPLGQSRRHFVYP